MDSDLNLYDYICPMTPIRDNELENPLTNFTEDELIRTMDEIIEQKYPDNHEYDVLDSDEEPQLKKARLSPVNESRLPSIEYLSQIEKIVKKMHGCKEHLTPLSSCEDINIHQKIEKIFSQMKKTVK
jgi:hypothetical protein